MIIRRHSEGYNFYGNTETGHTLRWGDSLRDNPVCAPWPELADISISNHCSKECDFCYRDSSKNNSFMTVKQYDHVLSSLISEKWGPVFQVALGGGEPLEHPDFQDIIMKTCEKGIVANFTTNGMYVDKKIAAFLKGKIGAVAVSAKSVEGLDTDKIGILSGAGIKTNVHYILDKESIKEAVDILNGKYNKVFRNVNGLIFLTYKPKGRAPADKCLDIDDDLEEFLGLIDNNKCSAHIGFDACFVPALMRYTDVNVDFVDSCECGFFSVYIDECMNVRPCSFSDKDRFSYNLDEFDMRTIWEEKYAVYRDEILKGECSNEECKNIENCRGKCIYFDELAFCYR